jgi:hypothetical protein
MAVGREAAEAQQLWAAVRREAPRTHAPSDAAWLASLLGERGVARRAPEVTLSTVIEICPVAAMKTAHWRSRDVPGGGQQNCPEWPCWVWGITSFEVDRWILTPRA